MIRNTYTAVGWFVGYMLEKLRHNEHKGDSWQGDDPFDLLDRVEDELQEARNAWTDTDCSPEQFAAECADIANMAMMAADAARNQARD